MKLRMNVEFASYANLNSDEKRMAEAFAGFVEASTEFKVELHLAFSIGLEAIRTIYHPTGSQLLEIYRLLRTYWVHGESFSMWLAGKFK